MSNKFRTYLFSGGALLLLLGAAIWIITPVIASYIFAVGAAAVAVSYLTMQTKGLDFRHKRLHRFNVLASFLCLFSSGLMFAGRLEWVLSLTIAAILLSYTAFVGAKKEE